MASSPATAPPPPDFLTTSETEIDSSSTTPPSPPLSAPLPQSPPPDSAPPPASPPPSPPPPEVSPPPSPRTSAPPTPENTPSPPPRNENARSPPLNDVVDSPPPPLDLPPDSPSDSPPDSPPPPPPSPGSPPAPAFSPPSPGRSESPPSTITPQSPPSPGRSQSPPPPRSPSTNRTSGSSLPGPLPSSPSSDNSVTLNSGVVVAIVIGGLVIIVLLVICLIWSRRKKKPRYYVDPVRPSPPGGEQYYYGTQQFGTQNMDHIVKIPPPPGVMGTPGVVATPVGACGPPPTPPPVNTSSDFNSGNSRAHPPAMAQTLSPAIGAKSQFTYEELAVATGTFSQNNLLGQGGFGYVHKGVLPDGKEVAVKSLKSGSGQGEREFQAEVEIISRVHHRHLVSLVGYCIADGQRMLVYEFVPNKTLEFHLHGKGQPVMDWALRLRIALGSARGLAYLHEDCHPRIIHRDIKAANILLDLNYEAMVADFGLAKLTSDNYSHVSTRVMGTFGYLAPEYASSGKLTEKSDVFSFGVMLLELITGRRPVDLTNKIMEDSLVDWARPLLTKALEDGNYNDIVDPRLQQNYDPDELARMVACAAASIRHSGRRRPKMSQIVRALDGVSSLEDLSEGMKPGQTATMSPSGNATYDTRAYDADMTKFRKMVMTSQELNSSEYGGTSEYGLNPSSSSSSDSREMDTTSELRKL